MATVHKAMVGLNRNAHYHLSALLVQSPDSNFRDAVASLMATSMLDVCEVHPGNRCEIDNVATPFIFIDTQPCSVFYACNFRFCGLHEFVKVFIPIKICKTESSVFPCYCGACTDIIILHHPAVFNPGA